MSRPVSVRTLGRLVGIGQRWARRADGTVVVVYQVHRGDRSVEAHVEGDDPCGPGVRFALAFRELAGRYRLLEGGRTRGAP